MMGLGELKNKTMSEIVVDFETFEREMVRPEPEEKSREELMVDAFALLDGGLGDMLHRELVSTNEVSDLLLDVRSVVAAIHAATH